MYAGKTKDFKKRVGEHMRKGSCSSIPEYVPIEEIEIQPYAEYDNEVEALAVEGELIKKYNLKNGTGWNHRDSGLVTKQKGYLHKQHIDYSREWLRRKRESDREEFNRKQREYYQNGGGKEAQRRYHESHRDEINARRREKRRLKRLQIQTL